MAEHPAVDLSELPGWRELCADFWDSVETQVENCADHPILRLAETCRGASGVAGFASKRHHGALLKQAIIAFADGGSAAWIHLAVFVEPQTLPEPVTSRLPRLAALLLALGADAVPDTVPESDLELFDFLRDLTECVAWDTPARSALLLHALRQAAVRYRGSSLLEERSHVTPWLVELLRHLFLNHRHFCSLLHAGDYCLGTLDDDPLEELRDELDQLAHLEQKARRTRDTLRQKTIESIEVRGNDDPPTAAPLRGLLEHLLHGDPSLHQRRSKPTLLSQHSFLVVAPRDDADLTDIATRQVLPYREQLQDLLQSRHFVLRPDGVWIAEEAPKFFSPLIEAAYAGGWPVDIVGELFNPKPRADGHVPEARWISDGEFTFFFLLVRIAWGAEPLPRSLLLPDFGRQEREPIVDSLYEWPKSQQEFLEKELGIQNVKSPRFLAFWNFIQRQKVHDFSDLTLCSPENCGLPALLNRVYSVLLTEKTDVQELLRLEIPPCCHAPGGSAAIIGRIRSHFTLPSLLIDSELRKERVQATSLFLLPFYDSHGASRRASSGSSRRPLGIYAGTFISLENDRWPHVLARHECHLEVLRGLMNPILDVFTAIAVEDYIAEERRLQLSKLGFDRTVSRFVQGLERLDDRDKEFKKKLQKVNYTAVVEKTQDFLRQREGELLRTDMRLAGALRALGSGKNVPELATLERRFESLLVSEIVDGTILVPQVTRAFEKLSITATEDFEEVLTKLEMDNATKDESHKIGEVFAFHVEWLHLIENPEERRSVVAKLIANLGITPPRLLAIFLTSTYRAAHGTMDITGTSLSEEWNELPSSVRSDAALAAVKEFVDEREGSVDSCREDFEMIWRKMRLHPDSLDVLLGKSIPTEFVHEQSLKEGERNFEDAIHDGFLALPVLRIDNEWKPLVRALVEERKMSCASSRHGQPRNERLKFRVRWDPDRTETVLECHQPDSANGLKKLGGLEPVDIPSDWAEEEDSAAYLSKTQHLWSLCRGWLEIQLVLSATAMSFFENWRDCGPVDFETGVRFILQRQGGPEYMWK